MPYKLGRYILHDNTKYDLKCLSHQEGKLFLWMMEQYEKAISWADFQERTAKPVRDAVLKVQEAKRQEGDTNFRWENYLLYRIRFDMLRNVGIRTGELKGELSDMLMKEEKE